MAVIRKIEEKDINEVGRIYLKAFGYCEEAINYYTGLAEYVKFSMEQGYAYTVMEEALCGAILAYEIPDMFRGRLLYVELLAVLPEYQKKGYGKMLMNQIISDAKEKGLKEITIRTGCYMDSYQIYKNWGFKDTRSDARYMFKNLKTDKE